MTDERLAALQAARDNAAATYAAYLEVEKAWLGCKRKRDSRDPEMIAAFDAVAEARGVWEDLAWEEVPNLLVEIRRLRADLDAANLGNSEVEPLPGRGLTP